MGNEGKKPVISKLVKNDIEMITACFDEYYFIIPEGVIKPQTEKAGIFNVGDKLPVKGETYEFPEDFNIIDLHFKMVAKVRSGKLSDVIYLNDYNYDGLPALNMMGFSIKLGSDKDFDEFKSHFMTFKISEREKLAAFANRWFEIIGYRRISYV